MEPNTICSNCEKPIYKSPRYLKLHKIFFCNMICQNEFKSKNSNIIKVNCNYCGTSITKNNIQQRNSKTGLFFCNNLCKNRYLANNRRWQKDNVKSHQRRQKILYERANHTCQKCGYNENRKMLDVHHNDHNHKNNRYENLRVLCSWCHAKHHRLKEEYVLPVIITSEDMEKEISLVHFKRRRIKNPKKLISNICSYCKKEFTRLTKQKYCSYKCMGMDLRRIERPSKEQLLKEIEESNFCAVGRKYGVSDNAIRKWLKLI